MAGDNAAKRVGQTTNLPSLGRAVLYAILRATRRGIDVAALLDASPVSMLPSELIALRDLGAVVDLADHWPVVHVSKIPIQHARLAIAALPAFAGVFIDAGFTTLAWLDATLPPTMAVTLVLDPSVPGTFSTFAYAWGSRITEVIVKGHDVQPDPIPEILARCVNVQSVTIESAETRVAAAAYLAAMPTQHLRTLKVRVVADDPVDASAIVAWLQGSDATSFSLACHSVREPMALASAIEACTTLSSLTLDGVAIVQGALATAPNNLHHITALALSNDYGAYDAYMKVLLQKMDRALSFSLRKTGGRGMLLRGVMGYLCTRPSLESVTLDNWSLRAVPTTGACPRLTSFTLRHVQVHRTIPKIVQWLSTSHRPSSLDFSSTMLGNDGFAALARALPVWMARGLKTLGLGRTGLTDGDAVVLAFALGSGRNRRSLTIDLQANDFAIASVAVLLTTLGTCHDVTLRFGSASVASHLLALNKPCDEKDVLRVLVRVHKLEYIAPGTFTTPPRTSLP
ncbi:hypothetical protein SPRG_14662 [Saprolegnia parasitica CBS 223.65]|uniref:Uncharacterized protein n=1 Tax=Saprolegnia parasitica (strain CBS 223.65) TaxID=695850 RepID=A0A067BLU8_SAPPC|nr:hypothetical protein SPRG_14662 [Saprolegnia parasitica CBS 223.65]KDO19479.1 hypothetical protein SPRG_14662 [Saprolegnia parasitica CBS 223.65]|eukprot:XP_012209822.1 hypothetical protein SPRG_14662 [Saprolegnia parasitica CBS 223.65]